ncbi:hypothetical protein M3Y98_00995000 [Aphelenchoides besseyi]|nr:hypothetical protein M3Y98_00995000 [Aphelenchoides besseyi]KAI6195095.1 hypothetical protein M3Y96_01194600 [Aphelenchoides besseyi]
MSTLIASGDDSQSEIKKLPPLVAKSASFHLITLTLLFCCSVGGGFGFNMSSRYTNAGLHSDYVSCDSWNDGSEAAKEWRSWCMRFKFAYAFTILAFVLYFFTFLLMLTRMIMFMIPCEYDCKNDRTAKIMDLTVTIASGVAFIFTCLAYFLVWPGFSPLYTIVLTACAFGFSAAGMVLDRRGH